MLSRQSSLRQRLLPGGGGGSPQPAGQSGQAARVLANLMNSGIGTSAVAVALALRRLGLAPALAAMAAQAALGILANHIISRESHREGADTYQDLLQACYGKWGGAAVAVAQAVNSLGKTVVWLIILADLIVGSSGDGSGLLPELLRAAGCSQAAQGGWFLRRWPWIMLVAVAATPVVSVHSIDKLSGLSAVGNAAVALMTAVSMGLAGLAVHRREGHAVPWLPAAEGRSKRSETLEVMSVLPLLMGAAFTQNNINSVMHEVRPYRQGVLDAAQAAARLLTIGVFLAIGAANNVVFGDGLQPDVLLNYSSQGLAGLLPRGASLGLAAAMKLCFLVNGLLSLPLYLYPYQRNLWAALPDQSAEERMGDQRSFAATNTVSLAGCAIVAVLVPSVWKPLKLLGGTAVSLMAFVFPGMVVLKLGWSGDVWHRVLWLLSCLLVAVGLLQCVASVASQFT